MADRGSTATAPQQGTVQAGEGRVADLGPGAGGAFRVHEPAPPSAQVDRRIQAAPVVWLTTASPEGRPRVVPVWFSWDGRTFLVFTKPGAAKARNIRSNAAVMLALGDPCADFDVLLIEGSADVLDPPTAEVVPPSFFAAYTAWMAAIGLSRDDFIATYSLAVRIRPTRYLDWAGRSHLRDRQLQGLGAG